MIRLKSYISKFATGLLLFLLVCGNAQSGYGQSGLNIGFKQVRFNPVDTPSSNLTSSILQDDRGYLWIGTMRALYKYDGTHLTEYLNTSDTFSISSGDIGVLHLDEKKRIWIGTRGRGIDIYDPIHDRFLRNSDPLRNDLVVWSIYQPDSTTVWVGTRRYLVGCDLTNDSCEYFKIPSLSDRPNPVRDIQPDLRDSSRLWLATLYGLWSFDTKTNVAENHPMPSEYKRPEGGYTYLLMDLWQQNDTVLWATSWGGGMIKYRIDNGEWSRFEVYPPHSDPRRWSNVMLDLKPRSHDELWVATSHGFGIFDPKSGNYSFFKEGREPLLAPSFNHDAIGTTSDNRVVAGMYGGFNISDPLDHHGISDNVYPPEIQSVLVDGYAYKTDSAAAFLRNIAIDEDEKDISFTLASPGVFNENQLVFGHKLEGYDRYWQESKGRLIRYTNLGQGTYTLRIRSSLDGQNWTYGANPLTIRKSGHIWESPWFFAGLALLIALIAGLIYWINIRAIKKTVRIKSDYDKKIAGIEMAALRAQMNPHFMFNSLNSIKAYILKEKTDEASEYLTKFSRLMRAVLRNSKDPLVTLDDELTALELYVELEALRFEDEFKYSIHVDDTLDVREVVIPPLLIQPYVENAIRHGLLEKEEGDKTLLISVRKVDNKDIKIIIEDNGVGRDFAAQKQPLRSDKKRSFGMEITGDRIALIEQTLGIHAKVEVIDLYHEGQPRGTRVELRIPLISSHQAFA